MVQQSCLHEPDQLVQFRPGNMLWVIKLSFPQSCQSYGVGGTPHVRHEKILGVVELVALEPRRDVSEFGIWIVGIFCLRRQRRDDLGILVEVNPEVVSVLTAPSV